VRLLLDTHVWLWLLTRPARVPAPVRDAIEDSATERVWSAVSVWEIAVKHASGKLPLPDSPDRFVRSRMLATGAQRLPIDHEHALHVATLPPHHGDPFDRLLVAQAQVERLVLVTGDAALSAYDVEILWG